MRTRFPLRTFCMVLATLFVGLVCADTADACRRGQRCSSRCTVVSVSVTRACPTCVAPVPPKVMPKK